MTRTPQDLADVLHDLSAEIMDLSGELALLRTADEALTTARDTAAGIAESLVELANEWQRNVPQLADELRGFAYDLRRL